MIFILKFIMWKRGTVMKKQLFILGASVIIGLKRMRKTILVMKSLQLTKTNPCTITRDESPLVQERFQKD